MSNHYVVDIVLITIFSMIGVVAFFVWIDRLVRFKEPLWPPFAVVATMAFFIYLVAR